MSTGGRRNGGVKLSGRRHQFLCVLAAFIEKDEWVYVSSESLVKAIRILAAEKDFLEIEEDELGATEMIVRLKEPGDS